MSELFCFLLNKWRFQTVPKVTAAISHMPCWFILMAYFFSRKSLEFFLLLNMIFFLVGREVYQFLIGVVTNYCKPGISKLYEFIILYFGASEIQIGLTGLKSRCLQGWFLLEVLGMVCFLTFSGSWLISTFRAGNVGLSLTLHLLTPTLPPPSFTLKGPL